jgi:GR25 family glycosyltransferase involved in LPS biosynthesis
MGRSYGHIEDHYRILESKVGSLSPKNIDEVYVINLDQRPERWENCMKQLNAYGIFPCRFPGIYGWALTPAVLDEVGLRFQPGMWVGRECIMHFPAEKKGDPEFLFLSQGFVGKTCFSGWTVKGTIGCSLSHFSVLKNAYDSGYNTVWVMEDDISVLENPHLLSDLIDELDTLVGPDGWDVLYTDPDFLVIDQAKEVALQVPYMWRPDMPDRDVRFLAEHEEVGEHFMKIGSRMRAHSMIYRRCGLEKILDFYRKNNNFLPYDQEIALIPGIRLYVTKKSIVTAKEVNSDTRYRFFSN